VNGLAIRTNGNQVAVVDETEQMIASLPQWLQYLIGAYPTTKVTPGQLLVMEDQFVEVDQDLLLTAAREYVRTNRNDYRRFPDASTLWPVVEQLQARQQEQEQEARGTAFDEWFTRCQVLRVERLDILEGWYNGAVSDHELSQFAGEMERAGMVSAAASLRSRL